ncbi:MAG: radical SAM protein [Ruminococcaceae bacterium]|nr:radical SAM protein [Oscillospiraceae bacterium]
MADVVFITPNINGELADESVGTLLLATILSEKGIDCEILQFFRIGELSDFEGFTGNALKTIGEIRPKIVSFYTRCDTYHIVLKLAQRIKENFPDIYIVFGGPQSDITAEETVKNVSFVDFVCCGEGENTVYPLFLSLIENRPDYDVPGLVYRQNGAVIKNPRPELICDLDSIPMIDYSKLRYKKIDAKENGSYFPIDVGRGCPFACTYCSTKTMWGRKYRLKSPKRIVEEIKYIHDKFGVNNFVFAHDMFTLNREKVIETCKLIKQLPFGIKWKCSARLDCIDKELIDIMADSGMENIYIGIETGSPRMQKLINKNLNLDSAATMIEYIASKNIGVTASFIYGFPDETEDDLSETLKLISELITIENVNLQAHLCTFLPGTELTEKYKENMKPVKYYSDITGNVAIEECRDVIDAHPTLFTHLLEYQSELRTKLRFVKMFVFMWKYMEPVYSYISEKYSKENLIEMYFDFVNSNEEFLERVKDLTSPEWLPLLIRNDKFIEMYSDDEYYDIISDFYRMKIAETSEEIVSGGSITEIYCFSPLDRKKYKSLEKYERCVSPVRFKGCDGKVGVFLLG